MMYELSVAGLIALLFGLASYYGLGEMGIFSQINLALGGLALLAAMASGFRRLGSVGGPHSRPVIARGLALIAAAIALGVLAERMADRSDIHFDLTFEHAFEVSPAVRDTLAALPVPAEALLFADGADRRIRRTRLLLEALAANGNLNVRVVDLYEHPELAERYELEPDAAASNTVVLVLNNDWEIVRRPTEGSIYEALYRLQHLESGRLIVLRGDGEGDIESVLDDGYSGFVTALITEGYEVESRVSAAMDEVPEDTRAVIVIAPRRRLLDHTLAALSAYLERGGKLVVFLEPGVESGLGELLEPWGISSPNELIVDPASAPMGKHRAEGLDILAYGYESHHIVTRRLGVNQVTLFPGARPLLLRKPRVEDRLQRMVVSSARSWRTDDLGWLDRRGRPEDPTQPRDHQTLVATGRYQRDGKETRIVAFGDADVASNRYLRAVYNLDLVLNAVHWATEQTPLISLRPKVLRTTIQFPLPLENSIQAFNGVGMLLPELLLIGGAIVWLRRRAA
ncbi:MAG: DUF4350 domain-containing protein [Myxococcales bacterium]|nr:DUF4350 domain-containing protein [Myxococcales bacterium]